MANNGTKYSDYVVGLDIGTSKVVCIIGKYMYIQGGIDSKTSILTDMW